MYLGGDSQEATGKRQKSIVTIFCPLPSAPSQACAFPCERRNPRELRPAALRSRTAADHPKPINLKIFLSNEKNNPLNLNLYLHNRVV